MEEIRRVAKAYYKHLPEKDKEKFKKNFTGMDKNNDGKISRREYMKYCEKEKAKGLTHKSIFSAMDKDGNGSLDFEEAIVLFYIIESGRAIICMSCKRFMAGAYFSCSKCFFGVGTKSEKFDICCDCYGGKKFKHHHAGTFCDNYTLLSRSRSLTLEASKEKRSSVLRTIEMMAIAANLAVNAGCIIM